MKKTNYLLIILGVYLLAFFLGYVVASLIDTNLIFKVLIWDVISTIVVFIFSLIFNNSSTYDPYWSVVPIIVCVYLMIVYKSYSINHIIFTLSILFYSLRLTINWIKGTNGFEYEDWRYRHFRETSKNKFMWFIINFFGIHLVPTLFVFLGMLPLFTIYSLPSLSILSNIGSLIVVGGSILELISDRQMAKFRSTNKERKCCSIGLWKYCRHPNYLGEMLIWVGVFVTMILSDTSSWYYIIGMIMMIFMFNVISIPLIEKRSKNRYINWEEYKSKTHMELILPNKHI